MASTTQEELLRAFAAASGNRTLRADGSSGDGQEGPLAQTGDAARDNATADIASALRPQADTSAATSAGQNVEGGSQTEVQNSGGTSAGSVITDVLESGFGVVPMVGELLGLFGGGSNSQPSLLKYQMPSSISFTSAETSDGLSAAGYDQMGLPRVYDVNNSDGATSSNAGGNSVAPGGGSSAGPGAATPQITVSVQAMDAQSFMDRSSDIAQAVRSAMLRMSSINDVVNEL